MVMGVSNLFNVICIAAYGTNATMSGSELLLGSGRRDTSLVRKQLADKLSVADSVNSMLALLPRSVKFQKQNTCKMHYSEPVT